MSSRRISVSLAWIWEVESSEASPSMAASSSSTRLALWAWSRREPGISSPKFWRLPGADACSVRGWDSCRIYMHRAGRPMAKRREIL